jgi:hypothetical protein
MFKAEPAIQLLQAIFNANRGVSSQTKGKQVPIVEVCDGTLFNFYLDSSKGTACTICCAGMLRLLAFTYSQSHLLRSL